MNSNRLLFWEFNFFGEMYLDIYCVQINFTTNYRTFLGMCQNINSNKRDEKAV